VPDLDDDKNGALGSGSSINRGPKSANDDPILNPDGIYSGPSRRVAVTDGTFAPINGMPKDLRKTGRLTRENIASKIDLSRGRFS